jgi:tetratricopeptide (TPR) repeat protein
LKLNFKAGLTYMYTRTALGILRSTSLFKPKNMRIHQSYFRARKVMNPDATHAVTPQIISAEPSIRTLSIAKLEQFREMLEEITTMIDNSRYVGALKPIADYIATLETVKSYLDTATTIQIDYMLKRAYNFQGICYRRNIDINISKLAPDSFKKALAIDENFQDAKENLAEYNDTPMHLKEALKIFDEIIDDAKKNNFSNLLFEQKIVVAAALTGKAGIVSDKDKQKAIDLLEKAIELSPHFDNAKQMLSSLQSDRAEHIRSRKS